MALPAGGNGDSCLPVLGEDGRHVLFEGSAGNLVAGDTNGVSDIFLREIAEGKTWAVSVSTDGGWGHMVSDYRLNLQFSELNDPPPTMTSVFIDTRPDSVNWRTSRPS